MFGPKYFQISMNRDIFNSMCAGSSGNINQI